MTIFSASHGKSQQFCEPVCKWMLRISFALWGGWGISKMSWTSIFKSDWMQVICYEIFAGQFTLVVLYCTEKSCQDQGTSYLATQIDIKVTTPRNKQQTYVGCRRATKYRKIFLQVYFKGKQTNGLVSMQLFNPCDKTNSRLPEMEFLKGIFSQGFLGVNSSLLTLEFLAGFYPLFPFYKMLFMIRLKFSCFAEFLWGFLKPEKSMVFF